jgi:hypothetical protein
MKRLLAVVFGCCSLAACVSEPYDVELPPAPPPPDTNVYFYPTGRSVTFEQQDRDRYECNQWAVTQTHFDPSQPYVPPHQRVQVVVSGPPPGAAVGAGAVTGAVVGGAVARPWESGRGALLGAVAGAAIGGVVEAAHANEVHRAEEQASANANGARAAELERQASQYRRAISACLEARGYTVR